MNLKQSLKADYPKNNYFENKQLFLKHFEK